MFKVQNTLGELRKRSGTLPGSLHEFWYVGNIEGRVSNSDKADMALRILLADDNPKLRTRLARLLTSAHDGWVICAEAENGQQAVSKTIDLRPDVVVLDLSMPVMDGLEAAREIANVFASVPIFLYTLHTIPALEQEAGKFGITQVICKPNWQSLFDAIESFTKGEGEDADPPSLSAPGPSCPGSVSGRTTPATRRDYH